MNLLATEVSQSAVKLGSNEASPSGFVEQQKSINQEARKPGVNFNLPSDNKILLAFPAFLASL